VKDLKKHFPLKQSFLSRGTGMPESREYRPAAFCSLSLC
jgi:hypothetical protein